MEKIIEKNIEFLTKKCTNKKIVFYCIGDFFNTIDEKYDLRKMFDIEAICDFRFENENIKTYKNYKTIKPTELKNISFDYLIIISPNFKQKEKFIKENCFLNKNVKIINFFSKKIDYKKQSKKNYKKIIKNLKTKNKIKVLFICEENEKWCYSELYKNLKTIERFEVMPVCLFPTKSKDKFIFTQEQSKEFFEKLNIDSFDGYNYSESKNIDIKTLSPDIVFYQQPWYLNNENHPKNISKYALTVMSPYGYTILSEKEWGSEAVKEIYQNLWLYIAESPYHVKFFKKTAKMKDNLKAFGSLKLDNYKKEIKNNIWKKTQNFKIIYAPHHSIGTEGLKMSTFQNNYNDFLNLAKNNPQYSFVLKPHPMLKNAVIEHNLMTEKEYENYLNIWGNLDNSTTYTQGEYFDIFKTSDALITDCSSFLAEYFPTKKPIILLNRKDRADFDDFGKKLKKGFYIANDFSEVEFILKELSENKTDKLLKIRENIFKKYFYTKDKLTTDKTIEFLLKTLS